jgi:hypothetical protein
MSLVFSFPFVQNWLFVTPVFVPIAHDEQIQLLEDLMFPKMELCPQYRLSPADFAAGVYDLHVVHRHVSTIFTFTLF